MLWCGCIICVSFFLSAGLKSIARDVKGIEGWMCRIALHLADYSYVDDSAAEKMCENVC